MEPTIKCSHEHRILTDNFEVLQIKFEGKYEPGSAGSLQATKMREDLLGILSTYTPIGVIVDVRELEYTWGNSIARVFRSVHSKKYPSVVVISQKSCALNDDFIRLVSGREFYYNELEAIEVLQKMLNKKE